MKAVKINRDTRMEARFQSYPQEIKPKMEALRELVLEAAAENDIQEIEETLKWGEPSYLAKKGSTIRMDWKTKTPHQYAMYFKCTSKLVSTFRELYGDTFKYENNRAILFELEEDIPKKALKECIGLALMYHSVKHLPRLGK